MARTPAVAGAFYEADRDELLESLESCFQAPLGPGKVPTPRKDRLGKVMGLVSPHAGYLYSGSAAAWAYDALATDGIPDTAVIIGPNHYGLGNAISISPDTEWTTPLGTLQVDTDVVNSILSLCSFVNEDRRAHSKEHSIEVQLPFLQYIGATQVKIVPITIAHLNEHDAITAAESLGAALASALQDTSAVIIASTDFSHYVTKARAQTLDSIAINEILKLDASGLIHTVYSKQMTMCGVIGTAVMLEATKRLGANNAHKLTYYTSGDVTGDTEQVVGYGAVSVGK